MKERRKSRALSNRGECDMREKMGMSTSHFSSGLYHVLGIIPVNADQSEIIMNARGDVAEAESKAKITAQSDHKEKAGRADTSSHLHTPSPSV